MAPASLLHRLPLLSTALGLAPLLRAASASSQSSPDDVGYELLFEDVLEEFDDPAKPLQFSGKIPSYVKGTFIQTGPARWTWSKGGKVIRRMTHLLDGYSKIHKWEFRDDGSVAFTSKFLRSGFFEESQQIQDIALSVMAQPTEPPLDVSMWKFMKAPNDNNQVNVMRSGDGSAMLLSDTLTVVEVNQSSLETTHEANAMTCSKFVPGGHCSKMANVSNPMVELCAGASAHLLQADDGSYVGLREIARYADIPLMKEGYSVYRMRQGTKAGSVIQAVEDLIKIPVQKTSYTHSFGLTKGPGGEHIVVAQQPVHYDALKIATKATLNEGLYAAEEPSRFFVAPLQAGAEAVEIAASSTFFFGHFVNAFSPTEGKFVADINVQDKLFFDRFDLGVQRNKTRRDAWPVQADNKGIMPGFSTVTRYEIDLATRTLTASPIFGHLPKDNSLHEHDLFRLHPADYGREYCGYWAWQTYYNSSSFASWAVVRTELCGPGAPRVAAAWYRRNVYPGEAVFVPRPGSQDKVEGVLIFKTLDGTSGRSSLVVADAKSLNTLAEAELPVPVPFTVHGNWFPAAPPEAAHAAPDAVRENVGPAALVV